MLCVNQVFLILIVLKRINVNISLARAAILAINHTPSSPHTAVSTKRNTMGNNNVPKSDTRKERPGRSSAVKSDEKHISIHPTRYENENSLSVMLMLNIPDKYAMERGG